MTVVQGFGACIACGRPFFFNPLRVPSTTALTGKREPLCRECFDLINAKRVAAGQAPFDSFPDAYDPIDEAELPEDDA
jgi:hypothetical protein